MVLQFNERELVWDFCGIYSSLQCKNITREFRQGIGEVLLKFVKEQKPGRAFEVLSEVIA